MPIVLSPKSEAEWLEYRVSDITSSDVAALFDLSPYLTRFELWHLKKAATVLTFEESERMKWGNRLEAAIALGLAEDESYKVRNMRRYLRHDTVAGMGSSFDYEIVGNVKGPGILEIKVVDYLIYRDQWSDKEAPDHIEIQIQHQMEVANRDWTKIGALVGGNTLKQIERERDKGVGEALRDAVADFWHSIETDNPPDPDWERDADFISKLYSRGGGPVADLSKDSEAAQLANAYALISKRMTRLDKKKKAIKAQLLTKIDNADAAILDGFKVSAKEVAPADISYTREAYRGFRVNPIKPKAKKEAA